MTACSLTMELSVPIFGVTEANKEEWNDIWKNFQQLQNVSRTLGLLRRFFLRNDLGFLSAVVILKQCVENLLTTKQKLNLIECVQGLKFLIHSLYKKIKDQCDVKSSIKEIFYDCKARLLLLLEEGCGCGACCATSATLSKVGHLGRPPKLTPHKPHCSAQSALTCAHNHIILGINPGVSEWTVLEIMFLPSDFYDFNEHKNEISLVATCINCCWLYFMLQQYMSSDFLAIEEALNKTYLALHPNDQASYSNILKLLTSNSHTEHVTQKVNVKSFMQPSLYKIIKETEKNPSPKTKMLMISILGSRGLGMDLFCSQPVLNVSPIDYKFIPLSESEDFDEDEVELCISDDELDSEDGTLCVSDNESEFENRVTLKQVDEEDGNRKYNERKTEDKDREDKDKKDEENEDDKDENEEDEDGDENKEDEDEDEEDEEEDNEEDEEDEDEEDEENEDEENEEDEDEEDEENEDEENEEDEEDEDEEDEEDEDEEDEEDEDEEDEEDEDEEDEEDEDEEDEDEKDEEDEEDEYEEDEDEKDEEDEEDEYEEDEDDENEDDEDEDEKDENAENDKNKEDNKKKDEEDEKFGEDYDGKYWKDDEGEDDEEKDRKDNEREDNERKDGEDYDGEYVEDEEEDSKSENKEKNIKNVQDCANLCGSRHNKFLFCTLHNQEQNPSDYYNWLQKSILSPPVKSAKELLHIKPLTVSKKFQASTNTVYFREQV
uniref:Uncharacterized protein n=1 Tax=Saimiriine herpesvirus 2 (strain 488) TaxID=10384 RepID=Q80BM9_SHV2C|nr:hypothetical protein [Saimiriine gammaherpesvirus 2]